MGRIPKDAANFTMEAVRNFSPTNGCGGITSDIMAGLPAASYFGFRSACLANILSTAYLGVTPAGVALFDPTQVGGITGNGMGRIPRASATFTLEAVANFSTNGCSGITSDIMAGLPDISYGGFQFVCFENILSVAYLGTTASKITNIPPTSVGGIQSAGQNRIPAAAWAGFTFAQIEKFQPNTNCGGFYAEGLAMITPEAIAGISSSCIFQTLSPTWAGFQPAQVTAITVEACTGFTGPQISYIPNATIVAFTLEKLAQINPNSVTGFTSQHLYLLSQLYGDKFVTLYTTYIPRVLVCAAFKKYFKDGALAPMFGTLGAPLPPSLDQITWFEVTYLTSNLTTTFFADVLAIQHGAICGLQPDQLTLLSKEFFSTLSVNQTQYIAADTMGDIGSDQLQAIVPGAFSRIPSTSIYNIPGIHVPWITHAQIANISGYNVAIFDDMPCDMITNFTQSQIDSMNTVARGRFQNRKIQCEPQPEPQPEPAPQPEGPPLSGGAIAGIVIGSLVGVAAIAGAAYYFYSHRSGYQAIPNV